MFTERIKVTTRTRSNGSILKVVAVMTRYNRNDQKDLPTWNRKGRDSET